MAINISKSEFGQTADWIKINNLLWGLYEKEMKVAISEGHYWVNGKSDGKIIDFIKIGFGKVFVCDYDNILLFPKTVAFLYEIYIVREFRGNRISSYLLNESCKFCKDHVKDRMIDKLELPIQGFERQGAGN